MNAFLKKFTLSKQEITALNSSNSPIGAEFFDALLHLHQINEDCNALMTMENPTAGLEILDKVAFYQENAYARLFNWAQSECRSLNRESPDISRNLKQAMRAMKLRPVLFE